MTQDKFNEILASCLSHTIDTSNLILPLKESLEIAGQQIKKIAEGDRIIPKYVVQLFFAPAVAHGTLDITNNVRYLLTRKGHDYANEDTLSNFKNIATMTRQDPSIVILMFSASKVSRALNLITGNKKPNNESLHDSLIDLACYSVLLIAMEHEKEENHQKYKEKYGYEDF
ncbi:MAG TPA: hypothetical protein VEA37_05415 [Flavobacterium sp.]|nr:hypothetical protein [Flavobacterium sp.]